MQGMERSVRPSKLQKEYGSMKKDTKTENGMTLAEKMAECADLLLLHSRDRMLLVKGPFEAKHKAYMGLALAASEVIKAFVALDKSLK